MIHYQLSLPPVFAKKNIPNLLTMLRLVLAAVFFVLLAFYRVDQGLHWLLIPAIVLFIAAAITDALDGYYARLWQVESKFGRIMDPFCDKVLVIGALCFLAGPGFMLATVPDMSGIPNGVANVAGIYPWMIVVIIARELLVTGIRGEMESSGHKFGANLWGKLKMILQAIVVPVVLALVFIGDAYGKDLDHGMQSAIRWSIDLLVYATVIVTVVSGIPYVTGAYRVTKGDRDRDSV